MLQHHATSASKTPGDPVIPPAEEPWRHPAGPNLWEVVAGRPCLGRKLRSLMVTMHQQKWVHLQHTLYIFYIICCLMLICLINGHVCFDCLTYIEVRKHARTSVMVHATAAAVAVEPSWRQTYRNGLVRSFTTRIGRWDTKFRRISCVSVITIWVYL